MNGDALNFAKSKARGVYAAAFSLAHCSCSVADRGGDCSAWKHMPGMRCGTPNITSAVDVAVSSLGALRSPSNTQGSV